MSSQSSHTESGVQLVWYRPLTRVSIWSLCVKMVVQPRGSSLSQPCRHCRCHTDNMCGWSGRVRPQQEVAERDYLAPSLRCNSRDSVVSAKNGTRGVVAFRYDHVFGPGRGTSRYSYAYIIAPACK